MLLDNLIAHLEELRTVSGGKTDVYLTIEEDGMLFQSNFDALTVLRTEDGISIRNF